MHRQLLRVNTQTAGTPSAPRITFNLMRAINYIVLHCTATPQNTSIQSILNYWRNVLGWKNPGYHFIIKPTGEIVNLLPIEQVSNGVAGFNANSIHISYIGGVDTQNKAIDNRTKQQVEAQLKLINMFRQQYPNALIKGHRDFPNVKKQCPSFDVASWLKKVGIK